MTRKGKPAKPVNDHIRVIPLVRCCSLSDTALKRLKKMKKLFKPASSRSTHIPAINVALENTDVQHDLQYRLKSGALPLHRRIKADREFGVRSDVYPYESTFDDDSDIESMNVDSDADMRKSKWTSLAEAFADNSSRVKQSVEPAKTSAGEKADVDPTSASVDE